MKKILIICSGIFTFFILGGCSKKDTQLPAVQKNIYVAGLNKNATGDYESAIWKNGVKQILATNNAGVNSVYASGTDVYAAGQIKNTSTNKLRAVLWKNGVPAYLTEGTNDFSSAISIYAAGADVYVAGTMQDVNINTSAVYWKNGTKVTICSEVAEFTIQSVNGIAVSGSDVYTAGTIQKNNGKYYIAVWKNTVLTEIGNGSSNF